MKQVQKKLESIAKSIQALALKVENIQKQVESPQKPAVKTKAKPVKKQAVKKAPHIKPVKLTEGDTAYSLFLKVIEDSGSGISVATLKAKTGFDGKKISNLVYKAKKQGKIKATGRGIYVKG
jgi:predicted Rossmann fold nucleotide-binding protein DprA/Smf involved in DNA uptake